MKKIAIEEHVAVLVEQEYKDLAASITKARNFPDIGTDPDRQVSLDKVFNLPPEEHRIPEMDKADIEIQILSAGEGFIHNDPDFARATANARLANDRLNAFAQKHPDRFRCFGILAMQDPQEAAKEVERIHKEYGFVGVMMHGATLSHFYDEPQFDPVWAALEECDMPLYLHPGNRDADQTRIYDGYPEILASTWDWGVFGGTHALRMVFGGVFERHPGAKLILGHMGEHLPYLLGRLDEGAMHRGIPKADGRISQKPSYYIKKNIYLTTSGGYYPEAMACAVMGMGADHILFACDYPHVDLGLAVQQVEDCTFLTDDQKQMVYYGSAEKLFKL